VGTYAFKQQRQQLEQKEESHEPVQRAAVVPEDVRVRQYPHHRDRQTEREAETKERVHTILLVSKQHDQPEAQQCSEHARKHEEDNRQRRVTSRQVVRPGVLQDNVHLPAE